MCVSVFASTCSTISESELAGGCGEHAGEGSVVTAPRGTRGLRTLRLRCVKRSSAPSAYLGGVADGGARPENRSILSAYSPPSAASCGVSGEKVWRLAGVCLLTRRSVGHSAGGSLLLLAPTSTRSRVTLLMSSATKERTTITASTTGCGDDSRERQGGPLSPPDALSCRSHPRSRSDVDVWDRRWRPYLSVVTGATESRSEPPMYDRAQPGV